MEFDFFFLLTFFNKVDLKKDALESEKKCGNWQGLGLDRS